MGKYLVEIPGPIEPTEKELRTILNDGIQGAWIEPIIVQKIIEKEDLEYLWDEFNKENGWWWPGYLEDNFCNHYDGAEEFKKFLLKKLDETIMGEEKETS